jgi:glycosyltransferase involved in cell wall biosynthesis
VPLSVIDAIALAGDRVSLIVVGYETVGSRGYWDQLKQRAISLGVGDRVQYLGPKSRYDMMQVCRQSDLGLAFMPNSTTNINLEAIIGASNKPFDYLACGLALLVSDLPTWREMFVRSGYAKCCNPDDAESIARAIRWFLDNPGQRREMGIAGRQRIETEWNYETQFLSVLEYCSKA